MQAGIWKSLKMETGLKAIFLRPRQLLHLIQKILEISFTSGDVITYKAALDFNGAITLPNSNTSIASSDLNTRIIEPQWNNENVVFYNSGNNQLLIPLKYFSNTISTTISFSRVAGASSETDNIVNVPTVQFGNQQYFELNNVNSLIQTGESRGI